MVNICDQFDNHVKSSEHKILDSNISIKDYLETVKKICILFIKYKFIFLFICIIY